MSADGYFGGQSRLADKIQFNEGDALSAEVTRYIFPALSTNYLCILPWNLPYSTACANVPLEELNARDEEGRKAGRLNYRHVQALKEGRWTDVLEELDQQAQRTVRTLWLMTAFLALASAGSMLYTGSGAALLWPEAVQELLLPGLWLVYAIYAVRVTTERLQHLKRARVMLEIGHEEEQAQTAVEQ